MNDRQTRILCVVLAGFLLIAGWWPFLPFPRNHVSWLTGRHGLAFGPRGVAYDAQPLPVPVPQPADSSAPGFAVELSLQPEREPDNGVAHILTIDDGRTPAPLAIVQWKSELLVRVPDPGNPNRFREAGISVLRTGQAHVVVISGDARATTFYVDGRLSRRVTGFGLGPDSARGQLILGNSATGKNSWTGTLFGVALFTRTLEAEDVAARHAVWTKDTALALGQEPGLVALYGFTEGSGQQAGDRSPGQHHLLIPAQYIVLKKTVLGDSWNAFPVERAAVADVVLNVLGFVPFGVLAFFSHRSTSNARWLVGAVVATLAGATVSLVIEVGQVWLPTRDSSFRDLVCNTAGAGFGAFLAGWISSHRPRR